MGRARLVIFGLSVALADSLLDAGVAESAAAKQHLGSPSAGGPDLPSMTEIKNLKRRSSRHVKRRRPRRAPARAERAPTTATQPASVPAEPDAVEAGPEVSESEVQVSPFEESEPVPPPATKADRFQFTGWARSLLWAHFDQPGLREGVPELLEVPYDRLVNLNQLYMSLHYARGSYLEAFASGVFAFWMRERDPSDPNVRFNGFNGPSRLLFEPELRELHLGLFLGPVDIRIGQQIIPWGKGDLFAPNDVINPRDLREPLMQATDLLRIPVFLVRGDIDLQIGSLQLLYIPFLTPDRLDIYGSNWAMLQPDAPSPYRALFNYAYRTTPDAQRPQLLDSMRLTRAPSFADAQLGARFTASIEQFDFGVYYHWGYDRTPRFAVPGADVRDLYRIDFSTLSAEELRAMTGGTTLPQLTYDFARRHHVGLDAGTVIGPIALRLDASFQTTRVFTDHFLRPVGRPALNTSLSFEWQTGEFGKAVLVELSYMRLFGESVPPLLFSRTDNLGVAAMARWLFFEHLTIELRAMVGILPFSYALRPEVGLRFGSFTAALGGVLLGGSELSFGQYFQRNQNVSLTLRYGI